MNVESGEEHVIGISCRTCALVIGLILRRAKSTAVFM